MKALVTCLLATAMGSLTAQSWSDGWTQRYELQASVADGRTPLWLNANRYGLGSLTQNNGYVRARIERQGEDTTSWHGLAWGCGVDVVAAAGYTDALILQQCYATLQYKHGLLTLGQRQQPMPMLNNQLSSGAQTLGINARPVPGVRLELPEYYPMGWLAVKGHVSYGWMTDGDWQAETAEGWSHYAQGVMLHTKAGYLRIGPDNADHPFSVELGLEMACQFGGTMYHTNHGTVKGATGVKAWVNAFLAQGDDEADETYHNVGGNHLGSWVARMNYVWPAVRASLYADHFFEDHSSMFFLDYDGYGHGDKWNERAERRYLAYPLRDMLLGLELRLKRCPWLNTVVVEHLDTRYQSGPIYHDHNQSVSDHIGGDDSYYNHYLYQGWTHWGQVMGNPLYRSPIYNDTPELTVADNRFYAWHLGAMGSVSRALDYRLLLSWQQGYGTYQYPFLEPQRNMSLLAEATYRPTEGWWRHTAWRAAFALDSGELLGDNLGLQLTFIYHLTPRLLP